MPGRPLIEFLPDEWAAICAEEDAMQPITERENLEREQGFQRGQVRGLEELLDAEARIVRLHGNHARYERLSGELQQARRAYAAVTEALAAL